MDAHRNRVIVSSAPRDDQEDGRTSPLADEEAARPGEGRESEASRRATRAVLVTQGGFPSLWLLLLIVVFLIVALVTFGLLP